MPHITPAHLHVLVNHIPVVGLPIILLLLAWGLARREDAVVRAALIGTVLLAAGTWFTDYTGDGAKDDIRHLPWANKAVVKAHEDAGDQAELVAIATGVVALATLILARGGRPMRRPPIGDRCAGDAGRIERCWSRGLHGVAARSATTSSV